MCCVIHAAHQRNNIFLGIISVQQQLNLILLGNRLIGLAVGRCALLVGTVLEQHADALGVPLPNGGQQRCDAVLVHLLVRRSARERERKIVNLFLFYSAIVCFCVAVLSKLKKKCWTHIHFGPLLEQIGEHIGLSIIGRNVQRKAFAHLRVHIEGLRFADAFHLLQVTVLDRPHEFVHGAGESGGMLFGFGRGGALLFGDEAGCGMREEVCLCVGVYTSKTKNRRRIV